MPRIIEQNYYRHRTWKTIPKSVVNSAVKEIVAITQLELNKPLKELIVLDVGCGSGEYSFTLEKYVKMVVGVEPYKPRYDQAIIKKRELNSQVLFFNKLIEEFSFNRKFDLVISLTTIEHMPHAERSFKRIFSLMGKEGIIYLTAPNKLWPLECHYKLPFLSWLPLKAANLYVKIAGKANSYDDCAYSKSYFGMIHFFNKFPCEYKFILPKNLHSAYFGCGDQSFPYQLTKKIGIFLIKKFPAFWIFSKGFIMVVRKI